MQIPIELRVPSLRVSWGELTPADIRDPFFAQTIYRMRAEGGGLAESTTDIEALLCREREAPPCVPSGFIFHMSRCGSTAVANALRQLSGAVVVSEAPAMNAALSLVETGRYPERQSEVVRAVISAMGRCRASAAAPYIVKFSSWNVLHLPFLRTIWPTVKWVFLFRHPVEVMVSTLSAPPEWLGRKSNYFKPVFGWTRAKARRMSDEEYCATVLGGLCRFAERMIGDMGRAIDYERIDVDAVADVAGYFGCAVSDAERQAIAASLQTYSKDADGGAFSPDDAAKRLAAAPMVRMMADKLAMEPYLRLRALS